jgi:hypothetical protein
LEFQSGRRTRLADPTIVLEQFQSKRGGLKERFSEDVYRMPRTLRISQRDCARLWRVLRQYRIAGRAALTLSAEARQDLAC